MHSYDNKEIKYVQIPISHFLDGLGKKTKIASVPQITLERIPMSSQMSCRSSTTTEESTLQRVGPSLNSNHALASANRSFRLHQRRGQDYTPHISQESGRL